ncbi:hypothetical protein LJC25_00255 [Bacteroidales bacterium OttesenSCG-928-K03]|nr:hypothetical protein [Odoribacter sp. OttesenSCG-928-L07]MDL2242150.1 hypothetical protein [Bacteroidales bacterium OttesenSCG-928-K03]
MEEWIYVVLGFAWIVLSAVIGNKKKKTKENIPSYEFETINPFDQEEEKEFNDFRDFFNKTEINREKNLTEIVPIELKTTPKNQENIHENVKKTFPDKKLTKKIHFEPMEEYLENQDIEERNLFNLRQAIIFSEILRTPYID